MIQLLTFGAIGAGAWLLASGKANSLFFETWSAPMTQLLPGRDDVRKALRSAASAYGIDPNWPDAIAWVESRWNPAATNLTGNDASRGGAYGATQITDKTARNYGYTGEMMALTTDLALMADLTMQIMSAGPQASFEDACAWWNAGKTSAANLPSNGSTAITYIPRAQAALSMVISAGAPT